MANSLDRKNVDTDNPLSSFHGIHFHEPVAQTQEERIALMAERYSRGEDLWTGTPRTTTIEPKEDDSDECDD